MTDTESPSMGFRSVLMFDFSSEPKMMATPAIESSAATSLLVENLSTPDTAPITSVNKDVSVAIMDDEATDVYANPMLKVQLQKKKRGNSCNASRSTSEPERGCSLRVLSGCSTIGEYCVNINALHDDLKNPRRNMVNIETQM